MVLLNFFIVFNLKFFFRITNILSKFALGFQFKTRNKVDWLEISPVSLASRIVMAT